MVTKTTLVYSVRIGEFASRAQVSRSQSLPSGSNHAPWHRLNFFPFHRDMDHFCRSTPPKPSLIVPTPGRIVLKLLIRRPSRVRRYF
jgi:hypothetical protein